MQKRLGGSRSAKNFKEMHLHIRMGITECQKNLEIGDHRVPKHWGSQGAKKNYFRGSQGAKKNILGHSMDEEPGAKGWGN